MLIALVQSHKNKQQQQQQQRKPARSEQRDDNNNNNKNTPKWNWENRKLQKMKNEWKKKNILYSLYITKHKTSLYTVVFYIRHRVVVIRGKVERKAKKEEKNTTKMENKGNSFEIRAVRKRKSKCNCYDIIVGGCFWRIWLYLWL